MPGEGDSPRRAHLPHLSPAHPPALGASTVPRGLLGSDNGMTGQSTGYGQYMPPWTPYIASTPVFRRSAFPPSAFGNSQLKGVNRPSTQTPWFSVSPPLSARCVCMAEVPLVCATASHASLSRPGRACLCGTCHGDGDRPATTTTDGVTRAAGGRDSCWLLPTKVLVEEKCSYQDGTVVGLRSRRRRGYFRVVASGLSRAHPDATTLEAQSVAARRRRRRPRCCPRRPAQPAARFDSARKRGWFPDGCDGA
ncbi:hypothetical protein QBC39DRAFT_62486 [Podospora conica]|nr:hypothetical protein QBC39DRAFT_62486 [Schizothecium conicum]